LLKAKNRKTMNRKIVLLFILFLSLNAMAGEVRFTMSAPDMVSVGEQFSLSLSLNAEGNDLKMPDMPNFDILMGPSVSQSRSYSVINGKMDQSVNYTYTYVLRAQSEGNFTIPAASIKSKRETYQSNSVTIKVIKGRQQPAAQAQQGSGSNQDNSGQTRTGNVSRDKLFIEYTADKRNVYKGEMISVALKLYSRVSLSIADQTLPSFDGFWAEDIPIPNAEQTQTREAVDGVIYNVYTLQKKILVPQQTGTLYIEPAEMVFNIQQRVAPQSMFDDFFGSVQNVRVPVKTNRISINVKELPAAPAGFKGAVGHFTMSSTIDKTDIKSNEAITIKTKISGSGNLKHINPITYTFPPDFEVYEPKTSYDYKASESGINGSTSFEQVFIPRYAGNFNIPSENFVYFDPSSQSYKTLPTPEFSIHVTKGADDQSSTVVSSISKQDVKYIGKDIRYIKTENPKFKSKNSGFFGSFNFYMIYFAVILAFAFLVFFQQKRIKENANIALMRNRQANKLARKHLNAASICVKNNNRDEFFEALLKAFWGYLSDKLTLPLSELNRDNAKTTLLKYNVEETTINEFIGLIDICEMARFAPTAVNESIEEMYQKAETLISNFEKQIRKKA
jgi:hypothetical protein